MNRERERKKARQTFDFGFFFFSEMSLNYARELLKISVSEMCSSIGFDRTSEMAMDILVDICERQFEYLIKQIHDQSIPFDQRDYLQVLFVLLTNSTENLFDYENFLKQFQSIQFANEIIQFPYRKKNQFYLRIPPKDSPQILQRDENPSTEYIYDWLPLFPDRKFHSLSLLLKFVFFRRNTRRKFVKSIGSNIGKEFVQ